MAVRLYPDVPRRRNAAIAGDVAVVALLVVFAWLGFRVHDSVARLAGLGRGVQSAGASVQGAFRQAGGAVGGVPIVGGDLRGALQNAGRATGGQAISAGRSGERDALQVARLLGWLTFLVPAVLLLTRAVPRRVAQVRRLTAAERALRGPPGVEDAERRRLLATRAAFHLPFGTLLRHTRDPLGDLAAGRHDALVAAELEDAGLLDRSAPRRSG